MQGFPRFYAPRTVAVGLTQSQMIPGIYRDSRAGRPGISGARVKLTEMQVRRAKAEDGKNLKLSDGAGLVLVVTPAGGKFWRYRYEIEGRERLLSLGAYPAMGLADARAARDAARADLRAGRDPAQVKKLAKLQVRSDAAATFEAVAREWHGLQLLTWSPTHAADVIGSLERDVFPAIGMTGIRDLTPPIILAVLRLVEQRGSIETAKRLRQRISAVFVFGIAAGYCDSDPAAMLQKALTPLIRGKQPAITDLSRAREMLRAVEASRIHPGTKLAMRLLALVVLRPGALITTPWAEVAHLLDSKDPLWIVPAARMKLRVRHKDDEARDHLIPLSHQAVDVLRAARVLSARSLYVFPGNWSSQKSMSENALGYALNRVGYHREHVPHGWRATFSTVMNEEFIQDRDIIDFMLGHVPSGTVEGAYNRALYLPRRRELAQIWADKLLHDFPPAAALLEGPRR